MGNIASLCAKGRQLCCTLMWKLQSNSPVLRVDEHLILTLEQAFGSLAQREHFTKNDLNSAYQELLLDDDSGELATINTQKGLHRYKRLPFCIASSPAICFPAILFRLAEGKY